MGYATFELLEAAAFGSLARMVDILDSGIDVNSSMPSGETALITASGGGDVSKVECLLEHGADIRCRTREGADALMTAVAQGHLEIVKILLAKGADYSLRMGVSPGLTPLCMASQMGDVEIVSALVSAGADVNQTATDGSCPLMNAVFKGHAPVVRYLLRHGADGHRTINDVTLRDLALQWGYEDICSILDESDREKPIALDGAGNMGQVDSADFGSVSGDGPECPARTNRNVMSLGPIRLVLWCLFQVIHLVFIIVMLPIGFVVGVMSGAGRNRRQ